MNNNSHVGQPYAQTSLSPNVEKLYGYLAFPRMLLEIFLRRKFGKYYLSIWRSLLMLCALACWPLIVKVDLFSIIWHLGDKDYIHPLSEAQFWGRYASWYAFLGVYLFLTLSGILEAMRAKGHTQYPGDMHPLFFKIKIGHRHLATWFLEIICEPLVCFVCGYALSRFGQSVGTLIMVSSAFYSLHYIITHHKMNAEIAKHKDGIIDARDLAEKVIGGGESSSAPTVKPVLFSKTTDDEIEDVR